MKQFFKDYGTLIIAVYGVVQIWLIALWKRYVRTGRIVVYPSGRIELGHSNFGPTIAINGTLLSINKEVFVSSMQIKVKRKKDGAVHTFDWTAFRPPVVDVLNPRGTNIELPSGFIVKPDSPHRYYVFFSDRRVQEEIAPSVTALQQAWGKYLVDKTLEIEGLAKTGVSKQTALEQLFNREFGKGKECIDVWDIIRRNVYWEADNYDATLEIFTDEPKYVFRHVFAFEVDSTSYDKFRTNAVATIREVCLGEINYYFAYPIYAS